MLPAAYSPAIGVPSARSTRPAASVTRPPLVPRSERTKRAAKYGGASSGDSALFGPVAAGEERVVLVLAAAELLVDAGLGVAVEPLDRLGQRVRRQTGRRGQLGDRGGADPGAGLEVGGRVALGHRDRREPAVLAGVEDVPGRDPLRRLGHLAAEPVVGQALVGVAAAGLVDHQPAAEAEGERAAAVRLLEAGAEPAQRAGSRWPRRARRRPRSARRCWCRAAPSSRRCRRARRARGAAPRCPRSRRRPAARRGAAPISIGPSGDIAATPMTRPRVVGR